MPSALAATLLLAGTAWADTVSFGPPSGPIVGPGCATVDVVLTRTTATPARGISVTIRLSPELALCTTPSASITRGSWLDGFGVGTPFYAVSDLGGNTYRVDQMALGSPCGPTGDGTLCTISVKAGAVPGTAGTIDFSSPGTTLQLSDCSSGLIPASAGGPVTVNIGVPPPDPITNLDITQVRNGNDSDGTIKTRFEFTLPAGATGAEIYCAPFGNDPEFDDPPGGPSQRRISFQPLTAPTPPGYETDNGLPFDPVREYGWVAGPLSTTARGLNPGDPRDSFASSFNSDPPGVWEIQVGPGPRQVRVVCGDSFTQGRHRVAIEGVVFLDNVLTNGAQYAQALNTVTVGGDGLLTLVLGGAGLNVPPLSHTKLNLIEIGGTAAGPPGSVPPIVTGFPPPSEYALLAASATSPHFVESTLRDYYFYVVYATDAAGNRSTPVSAANGVLNYHLGDIFSAAPAPGVSCVGDNLIDIRDLSWFGQNYGRSIGSGDPAACVDIGPLSTTPPTVGLPVTDNVIDFQDLNVFAPNYGAVSKSSIVPSPAATNRIELVPVDETGRGTLRLDLAVEGTGNVRAVSVRLGWDPSVVEPLGVAAGPLLRDQGGIALQSSPGSVDFALLGQRELGLAGEGVAASVRFRRTAAGDPRLQILALEARDLFGRPVEIAVAPGSGGTGAVPRVTAILGNVPNPFNPSTRISFALARSGRAHLYIYSLDGRLVRRLVDGVQEAGLHDVGWDGTNAAGDPAVSGVYYARLVTDEGTSSRPVVLVK